MKQQFIKLIDSGKTLSAFLYWKKTHSNWHL